MTDIMKTQIRQLFRRKGFFQFPLIALLITLVLSVLLQSTDNSGRIFTASAFLGQFALFSCAVSLILPGCIMDVCCCDDFMDKTINHELTAGTPRIKVYFARILPGLVISLLCYALVLAVPFTLLTFMHGWGTDIPLSNVLLRLVLILAAILRYSCFMGMIAFLTKKTGVCLTVSIFAALACCGTAIGASIPYLRGLMTNPYLLSILSIGNLSQFSAWYTYGSSLKYNYIYYPALSGSTVAGVVIVSLVMSAFWLLLGYHYFHTDDLN